MCKNFQDKTIGELDTFDIRVLAENIAYSLNQCIDNDFNFPLEQVIFDELMIFFERKEREDNG